MSLISGISLLFIMLALAAIPSASVALVVTRSATHGSANGVAVALGIVLGDLVFVSLAILGMSFLAQTMGSFFAVLKIFGGAYLIWLGLKLIRAKGKASFRAEGASRTSLVTSCVAGFVLTLGDMKAILFYASLFPTFVDMASLTASDIALIILITVTAVGGVKIIYALVADRIVQRFRDRKVQKVARTTAGCAMVGAGTYLISKA